MTDQLPYLIAISLLLLALCIGAGRVIASNTLATRMLGIQLLGSIGVALLLMWGQMSGAVALFDVALVLALLSAVSTVALTRTAQRETNCD
jgi:multicomponent Na+:H+ antiporter subunit F